MLRAINKQFLTFESFLKEILYFSASNHLSAESDNFGFTDNPLVLQTCSTSEGKKFVQLSHGMSHDDPNNLNPNGESLEGSGWGRRRS